MKLVDVLAPEACVLEMTARTKKEALGELAAALERAVPGLSAKLLQDLLLDRERLGSTAMGDGIAIPHARVGEIDRLVMSFGRSRAGIEFESLDGQPTHLFFLLVAPKKEGSEHLLTLARLSRVLSADGFLQKLRAIDAIEDLTRALEEQELKL
jgi:PTS system nitrogen regulatory IIA component